jgi:hypothetical protein
MKKDTVFGIAWLAAGMMVVGYGIVSANLALVFLSGLAWFVVTATVALSRRRVAITRHGLPSLPPALQHIALGPIIGSLSAFLPSLAKVSDKTRRSLFGSTLKHTLHEGKIETEEGIWTVEIELCNADIVGYTISFASRQDSWINQAWGRTGRKAYFLSDPTP